MSPGLRCATASSFTYDWRAPPPDAPGFVPAVWKAKAEQRAIALSASRAQSWPGGLFAQVKEEAVAAGEGRGTRSEEASRPRRGPSAHSEVKRSNGRTAWGHETEKPRRSR